MRTIKKIILIVIILVVPFIYLTYASSGYFIAVVLGLLILFSPFIIIDLRNRKKL